LPAATLLENEVTAQAPQIRERESDRSLELEQQAEIRELLERAVTHVRMQQFTVPKGYNAYEDYRAVLQRSPDHPGAIRGIQAIQTRLKRWARIAERRGDWRTAARYYTEALVIEPESQALAASLQRVQAKLDALQNNESNAGAETRGSNSAKNRWNGVLVALYHGVG
jgi:tetratricopeptide (TPR) repeat protein